MKNLKSYHLLGVSTDVSEEHIPSIFREEKISGARNQRKSRWHATFSTSSRPVLGPTQPSIQWVPEVKRRGREADHSPPTSTEIKKTWICTSTQHAFMA
jgi:hypothetical protein